MLLENETIDKFGYSIKDLSIGSNKKVCLKCDYCNNNYETTYKNRNNSYKKLPKDACNNCKYLKNKEKNGNPFSKPEIQEKIKKTNLERYGTEWQVQSDNFKEKTKETCLTKYGTENYCDSDVGKNHIKSAMMNKYGVENPSQIKEFKEKANNTMLEKFGSKTFWESEECKKRIEDKYGVDNVFKLKEIQDKAIQTKINKESIKTYNGKSIGYYFNKTEYSYKHFKELCDTIGLEKALLKVKHRTDIEVFIEDFLKELGIRYKFQLSIGKYFADFVLEDYNLIIEPSSVYWHSELFLKDNYHSEKSNFFKSVGYETLFIFSDEIKNNPETVKSLIKEKLNINIIIKSNDTEMLIIENSESEQFLQENHLMGPGSGTSYGLTYNNQLLLVLQIKKIRDGHEISRLCSKNGFNIVGGFSKLLKHINIDKIKTFVDLRYGSGDHLLDLGFKEVSNNLSFHWTDGNIRFHRMKFPGDSGYDLGLVKIWDCGQKCFVKE